MNKAAQWLLEDVMRSVIINRYVSANTQFEVNLQTTPYMADVLPTNCIAFGRTIEEAIANAFEKLEQMK